jgi:hypothetical protein
VDSVNNVVIGIGTGRGTEVTELTRAQIMEVPCIVCEAKQAKSCREHSKSNKPIIGFHRERIELRLKHPVLPAEIPTTLNPTEKALICYYAFVMLCDSCEANSEKLFGKHFKSADVQRMFARKAIQELKKDGFID